MKIFCVDTGNTFVKIAVADEGKIVSVVAFSLEDEESILQYAAALPVADACIVSSVSVSDSELTKILSERVSYFVELTAETPIPIRNLYETPETLGKDRLAAVVGAYGLFPGKNVLVMDAGTALTVDFIDNEGNYRGGNISPGLQIRYRALHDYTKRLPLEDQNNDFKIIGNSTSSAIIGGVQTGMIFEIEGYIDYFAGQYPDLVTIMTGGDVIFFVNRIKKSIFAESDLVLIGLEKIIEHNINIKKSSK